MSDKKNKKAKDSKPSSKEPSGDIKLPDIVTNNPEFLEHLRKLDADDGGILKAMTIVMETSRSHSGPLPTAEQFKMYEDTHEGAGERILTCMEKEQQFRHDMDAKALNATISDTDKGQKYGFWVMSALIVLAFISGGLLGNNVLAGLFLTLGVVNIVPKFIDGRNHKKDT